MTVYIDIVFLENFFMNYIILFATAIINKVEIKLTKIAISSFIGSLYAVLNLTQILSNSLGLLLKILLSVAMVYVAFNPQNIKKALKQLIIFYLTSFTFGGVAFALLYFVKPGDILMKNGIYIGTYPIKIALVGGIVGFMLITLAFKIIKSRINKEDMFCKIEIFINNNKLNVTAILDTGNMLKEPITGFPVIIVENKNLKKIIPKEILDKKESIINGNIEDSLQFENYLQRFRIIPFSSIGKENGLLLGIKPDYIIVKQDEQEIYHQNVIIGIYDKNLSRNNEYNALIGLELLKGGEKHEYFGDVKV